jgi:hypothetical protein
MRGRVRVDNTAAHLVQLTLHLSGSTRGSGGGGPVSKSGRAKKQVSVPRCAACVEAHRKNQTAVTVPVRIQNRSYSESAAPPPPDAAAGGALAPVSPSAAPPPPPSAPPPPPDAAAGGGLALVSPSAAAFAAGGGLAPVSPPPPLRRRLRRRRRRQMRQQGARLPRSAPPPPLRRRRRRRCRRRMRQREAGPAGLARRRVAAHEQVAQEGSSPGRGGGVNRSKKISNDGTSRKKIELKHHQHTVTLQTDSHPHDAKTQNL